MNVPPPPVGPADPPDAGPVVPGGHRLADSWLRVGARVLDFAVAGMLLGALAQLAIVGEVVAVGTDSDVSDAELFVAGLASLSIWFVWEVGITAWRGGTPMKLALGLRVVRSDTGQSVGWKESLVRWAVLAVWSLIPVLNVLIQIVLLIVSLVFLFTKPLRQAVWDMVAKTIVVKSR